MNADVDNVSGTGVVQSVDGEPGQQGSAAGNAALTVEPDTPLRFSLVEFLLVSICIGLGATSVLLLERREIIILVVASTIILLLLLLLNRKSLGDYRQFARQRSLQRKAELYSSLYGGAIADDAMNLMRARAVQYSQDLIDDYKNNRRNSRNIYYIFQISTIVLSGVTPILVLLDKVDIQVAWIKWLPVIFPAIASIVTSLATSFPFQENWMAANRAVELLEAEQEKFILGVTPAYRLADKTNDTVDQRTKRKQRLQESVDSFIAKVNQIHLKQFVQEAEPDAGKASAEMGQASVSNSRSVPA
ncbi:MAG: DUF4231 domain-containing protein [Leptolyngbyaceae cyanobacterium]